MTSFDFTALLDFDSGVDFGVGLELDAVWPKFLMPRLLAIKTSSHNQRGPMPTGQQPMRNTVLISLPAF